MCLTQQLRLVWKLYFPYSSALLFIIILAQIYFYSMVKNHSTSYPILFCLMIHQFFKGYRLNFLLKPQYLKKSLMLILLLIRIFLKKKPYKIKYPIFYPTLSNNHKMLWLIYLEASRFFYTL